MYDKQETEARPQLDQFTTRNELANTLPHAQPVPTTDTYPSLAQLATNNMDVLVPVASTLPEGYAISISDCEEAGSDKQEPQRKGAIKPYTPLPKSLSPNPALDRILSQLQDLPTPPESNHPHSVDREVLAEPHCVHPVGANDAVSGQDTATTGAAAAERDDTFHGDLEDAQAKVIQLEAKVKLLEEAQKPEALKVEVLQQDLDEERKRHQQSIYDLQERTRSLEQSQQTAGELQTKILSLEESLSKSQVDLDTHKQEYKEDRARWHSNMNSLRSQITTMRIAGLDSNANQSQTAISSAKQDAKNTAQEIANLQAQVETATNRAERSENAVQKLTSLYDDLVTQRHTLSLEHKDSIQLANKLIIRWQRFFADLVYILFTLIEEDFSARRLREIMRQQGINRKIVRELKVREAQWEPFVAAALHDRCMDATTTYLTKMMDQHLPESAAEVLAQLEEAGR